MEKLFEFENKVRKLMGLQENKQKGNDFGFVMLYVDFPELKKLQNLINDDDLYDDDYESFGLEKNSHVTLMGFLLKEVTDKDIENAIKDLTFGKVKLHNISLFNNEKYDVLKFEVGYPTRGGAFLSKANSKLKDFPNKNEYSQYQPHSTITYLKPGFGKKYVELFKDKEYVVEPTKIVYSKTDGTEKTFKI